VAHALGQPIDIIEEALGHALKLATERGDLGAIQAVANELKARREAKANVSHLPVGRERGGRS
jgi:hypothetical protein